MNEGVVGGLRHEAARFLVGAQGALHVVDLGLNRSEADALGDTLHVGNDFLHVSVLGQPFAPMLAVRGAVADLLELGEHLDERRLRHVPVSRTAAGDQGVRSVDQLDDVIEVRHRQPRGVWPAFRDQGLRLLHAQLQHARVLCPGSRGDEALRLAERLGGGQR
eukprot:5228369-Pyramimonas_sp.AAC.1